MTAVAALAALATRTGRTLGFFGKIASAIGPVAALGGRAAAVAVLAALAARLGGELGILGETTRGGVDILAALAAGLGRQLGVLRESAILGRHALAPLTRNLTLLRLVHGREAAVGGVTRATVAGLGSHIGCSDVVALFAAEPRSDNNDRFRQKFPTAVVCLGHGKLGL